MSQLLYLFHNLKIAVLDHDHKRRSTGQRDNEWYRQESRTMLSAKLTSVNISAPLVERASPLSRPRTLGPVPVQMSLLVLLPTVAPEEHGGKIKWSQLSSLPRVYKNGRESTMSYLPTRLPLLSNARFSGFLFLKGYPNSRNLPLSQQFGESSAIFQKKMASISAKCDADIDNRLGVVHPATEAYAKEAIEALKSGKVIAVPTDTLYGFACDACSSDAVNRIYEIKGRQHTSPLAICVGDVLDIKNFAFTDHLPLGLLDSLLPGPVTVVLQRGESSILEKSLNPGLESIAVRVPDCNFIRFVARELGSALALTSANLSGQLSSLCVNDFENLWEHCAYVYDGGSLPSSRAGSTIVDLTQVGKFRILRPGSAKDETLEILEKHSLLEASSTST